MASVQRRIKPSLKRLLVEKAGGKCANPGCSNWRVHIHHIKHWAVYKTHDADHMIAICPSCHDAVHNGSFKISDESLYQWKDIVRPSSPGSAYIYIEPARYLRILTGSVCIESPFDETTIFELSNSNCLKLRVLDEDILQVNVKLNDSSGKEILRVVENNVRVNKSNVAKFDYRAGRVRITLPVSSNFAPEWLVEQVRYKNPNFASNDQIIALDLEVIKPGLVRIQGCWPDGNVGVVITEEALSFCALGLREPSQLIGQGEETVLFYLGPINRPFFGLGSWSPVLPLQ